MDVKHNAPDTLTPVKGQWRTEFREDLDSVILYYRDFNSSVYKRKDNSRSDSYSFNIAPPRDGSDMCIISEHSEALIFTGDKESFRHL